MPVDDKSAPAFDKIRREAGINTADAVQLLWMLIHDEIARRKRGQLQRLTTLRIDGLSELLAFTSPSLTDAFLFQLGRGSVGQFALNIGVANGSTAVTVYGRAGLTGSNHGPYVGVNRSTGTNNVPGMVYSQQADGDVSYLWADNAGLWRTDVAPPEADGTPAQDSGTVVGDQTSTRGAKHIEREWTDGRASLDRIRRTPVFEFTYKDGRYHGERFTGPTVEDSPDGWIGKDHGQSLNEISLFGHLLSAIKALADRIEALEARLSPHDHAI